jgi:hypothetical protein
MTQFPQDVTGFRGEKIVELCLTHYEPFGRPLFQPGFLGDKWPAIDFFVQLEGDEAHRPYFFVQAKSTKVPLHKDASRLRIHAQRTDVAKLLGIPGPTYIFGVHEPTKRVFARSIHLGFTPTATLSIPLSHELTERNLLALQTEVREFWRSTVFKPQSSVFA